MVGLLACDTQCNRQNEEIRSLPHQMADSLTLEDRIHALAATYRGRAAELARQTAIARRKVEKAEADMEARRGDVGTCGAIARGQKAYAERLDRRRQFACLAADLADMGLMMATTDPEALESLACRERNILMPWVVEAGRVQRVLPGDVVRATEHGTLAVVN